MGRATVTARAGRGRRRASRQERVLRALTAAGVNVLQTYDTLYGGQAKRVWIEESQRAGFAEAVSDWWPTDSTLGDEDSLYRENHEAVYRLADGSLAYVGVGGGEAIVRVAAATRAAALTAVQAFRAAHPATYLTVADDPKVPITFWSLGPHGPERRLRRIDASPWADIEGNYTAAVREQLGAMMTSFVPGKSGQLVLWQGPPGTGKTWALRALASEWNDWAEFHYITDPDAFFVESASYLVEVLLSDSYQAIEPASGDVYDESDEDGKWRVLVLEDTGELLSAHAKEKYGQGLSRLLNVVDGMIGQGLRVLVVVTTNDELGELNAAVRRPGRCAAQIEFAPLTAEEIAAWGADGVEEGATIAELYAGRGEEPLPETAEALAASASAWAANDVRAAVYAAALEHQPDEPGYGQTAYDEDARAVLWVSWDGTSVEQAEAAAAAFLAIDGVDHFDYEAEGLPDGWWDAEVVYPDDPPRWVVVPPEEAALADVLELARRPLAPEPEAEELRADAAPAPGDPLEQALAAISAAHRQTTDTVAAVLASAGGRRADDDRADRIALRTLDVLETFAARPAESRPIHVHVPKHEAQFTVEAAKAPDVHVEVKPADVYVDVPAQAPSVVHVAAPAAPAAPNVEVTVEAAAAPNVQVDVHPEARPPAPARPREVAVRVDVDDDGTRRFVVEEAEVA